MARFGIVGRTEKGKRGRKHRQEGLEVKGSDGGSNRILDAASMDEGSNDGEKQ